MKCEGLTVRHASKTVTTVAIFTASLAQADIFSEPHLQITPRTAEEAARIAVVTAPPTDFSAPSQFEENTAGAATVRVRPNADALSQPSGNIAVEDELTFKVGNGLFRKLWVSSPASTLASDGLGPLFNARSCQRCHLKDGRGHPPELGDDNVISMLMRVSIPGSYQEKTDELEAYLATLPDPNYGNQIQDFSIQGHAAEAQIAITYKEEIITLSDDEVVSLRRPEYSLTDLNYGPLHPDIMLSPRIAPQMIGLGLLEAIPAADILANADPDDLDGDGISGRPNIVWSKEFDQYMLGRFGLKAGTPTIRQQTAAAFAGDIGISSPINPGGAGECMPTQTACQNAIHGDGDERVHEVDDEMLDLVTFYSRNLAVPARRDMDDPQVLRGKEVFHTTGCAACHTPSYVTHRLENQPEQSFQLIWPYTDMLLHDMGEGLADHRPEAMANGYEWRTPPLWGVGLTEQVNDHTYFLHDGRARSLLEAILWHGGEAQAQRDAVIQLSKEDRDALIRFLESL